MKKIYYILTLLLCVYLQTANAQMGVNSTGAAPATSAILDVSSTTKGFLLPRMTTTQRNAIPFPATGLMIFNTTTAEIEVQRGLGWVAASRMAVPFSVTGNTVGGGFSNGIIQAFNSGTGPAISGQTLGAGVGAGLFEGGPGNGVYGISNSANGVFAESVSGSGLFGTSTSGSGVSALNNSSTNATGKFVNNNSTGTSGRFEGTNGTGVYGIMTGTGIGIASQTNSGTAGDFNSTTGIGINIYSSSNIAVSGGNGSAVQPVAQFANLSGGTALSVIATTAINMTGALKVSGGMNSQTAFKITTNTAGGGNTVSNLLTIPNTTLANNANDILLVTHSYSPNNTYLNKAYGVWWNGTNWLIYLEDVTAMPNNITFNVLVIKQ